MATITIRNLDEKIKRKLQVRAAQNGRSMEAEAREIIATQLESSAAQEQPEEGPASTIHRRFAALGGVDLEVPQRQFSSRPIPTFD